MNTSTADQGVEPPAIDFSRIRTHAGSQHTAFEELCVQIFRRDCQSHGDFHRVEGAGGDEGVEAYVVRGDKSEVGLQCKYFNKLEQAQWRQIDKSVRTAFAKHPRLAEYRIAIPLNRTPHQIKKWTAHTKTWARLTKRSKKFVWIGKSELTDSLSKPLYRDLLVYWFGVPQFNGDWMDGVIRSSIQNLDRRYTPKHHVDTEAGRLADTFAWSPSFEDRMKRSLLDLVGVYHDYVNALGRETFNTAITSEHSALVSMVKELVTGDIPSIEGIRVSSVLVGAEAALTKWETVHESVYGLEREAKLTKTASKSSAPRRDYQFFLMRSGALGDRLRRWRGLLHSSRHADKQRLLILGEAGAGKSHLIASIVEHARKRGQPALLLLGEHFTASDEPWNQARKVISWDASVEWLLSALNQAGILANLPALICVDALNESDNRKLWVSHLNAFAAKMVDYPFVRLIVSCRSDFKEITLPQKLAEGRDADWATIWHQGFGEELFEAVASYFSGYGVKANHFPPLIDEFRNPLFLRLFCEAFENQHLPDGPLTLERVMSARIATLTTKLQNDIDCSPEDVKRAIYAVARLIHENEGHAVDMEAARTAVNEFSPVKEHSRSLYVHLRSSGIFVEVTERSPLEPAVKVRFAFERFSDYFVAAELLGEIRTATELRAAFKANGRFAWMLDLDSYWRNRGLLTALAILVPERYQIELADLITTPDLQVQVLQDYLTSLPWRSAASFSKRSRYVLRQTQQLGLSHFLQGILRVATIPGHPYNAAFLHASLVAMALPRRELAWTIPVADLSASEGSVPSMVVSWAMRVPRSLVSDDQALLVARVLCWFLSSNNRAFRRRATVAAIRILEGRPSVAAQIIREFDQVNDPYVVERAYAVACGVAMRAEAGPGLRELSAVVHQSIFAVKVVRPNILLRDYARAVLEVASERASLPSGVTAKSFRPPYKSRWPKIWSERQINGIEKDEGWNKIVFSVRPECMGMYGDFGRYVMESRIHAFSSVPKTRSAPKDRRRGAFDGIVARRWVLQRVKELGWTPKKFGEYERNLPWNGRYGDEDVKTERISKKYQWIALHELLGYLSDHYHLRPSWNDEPPKPFEGAWQIWARDFDPSLPLVAARFDEDGRETDAVVDTPSLDPSERYPDPFANTALCVKRVDWVLTKPADFKPLVQYPHMVCGSDSEWVALNGFWEWEETEYDILRLAVPGRLKMWMHLRSWLVSEDHLRTFVRRAKGIHFWGHGCGGVTLGDGWIGEYPCGRAFAQTRDSCGEPDEWIEQINIPHTQTTCTWHTAAGFIVPSPQLYEVLSLRWSGVGAQFLGRDGQLAAFHTGTMGASKYGPCVTRLNPLRDALRQARLGIVWAFVGERRCWDGSAYIGERLVEFSGVYTLGRAGINGGLTKHIVKRIPRRAPRD